MHFRIEQPLDAPADAVVAAFASPSRFGSKPPSGVLDTPELLEHRDDGARVVLRLRYRFRGELSPAARRALDPQKLTWVQELEVHPAERQASFRLVPDHYRSRLRCEGQLRFEPGAGVASTVEVMEGDVVVSFPVVGRAVERVLVEGIRQYVKAEAAQLATLAGGDTAP